MADSVNMETVTVVRPGGRDRHGDPTGATEHTIAGVLVAPAGSSEDVSSGEQLADRWDLYLPVGSDIVATDRVRRALDPTPGDDAPLPQRAPWVVVGQPSPWRSPWSSWTPGMVVRVERHTG